MIGQAKMLSAVLAAIAPFVGGTLLIGTITHGFAQGWLFDETTLATVSARVVLLWIPVVWAASYATDPQDRSAMYVIVAILVAVPVVFVSLVGFKIAIAAFFFLLLLSTAP